ncbi:MAG: 6,7-dimethyl-8-ribityllumazine synthase [Phycisphaerales bacterium]|nr:MAG: 6,7-dimethyl-8-ribityllumazine synthase [Phycisphaerales bacterium]
MSSDAQVPQLAIVLSRYNASITDALLEGARAAYASAGGAPASLAVLPAPGTYELPIVALAAAESGLFQGVVALGCVIRGETDHDKYISQSVADGLMRASLETGVPIAFGVLTVHDASQAQARAGGVHGNKGAEAVEAVLDTLRTLDALDAAAEGGDASSLDDLGRRAHDKAASSGPAEAGR